VRICRVYEDDFFADVKTEPNKVKLYCTRGLRYEADFSDGAPRISRIEARRNNLIQQFSGVAVPSVAISVVLRRAAVK
jgi:hypothetical protein